MKTKMAGIHTIDTKDYKIIESGVYKHIKWEKGTYRGKDCNILLHLKHVDELFLHSLGLSKSSFKNNEGLYYLGVMNKIITEIESLYPVIDEIHNHILSQYEPGGCKYLESENKVLNTKQL